MRDTGAKAVSLSLDGASAQSHDSFRGVEGVFAATLDAARTVRDIGLRLQVNTTIARGKVHERLESWSRYSTLARPCGASSS